MCFISYYSHNFFNFQIDHYWLMYVCLGLMIVTEIPIFCCQAGRIFPYNMVLLLVFTIAEAYVVSCITSIVADVRGGAIVVVAACMTLGRFLSIRSYRYCADSIRHVHEIGLHYRLGYSFRYYCSFYLVRPLRMDCLDSCSP